MSLSEGTAETDDEKALIRLLAETLRDNIVEDNKTEVESD